MQRRTFLQGAAASLAAARFAPALAQNYPSPQSDRNQTIIYNKYFEQLNRDRFDPLQASPEMLYQYGFPQLPAPSSPLYDIWRRILGQPRRYAEPLPIIALAPDNQTNPRFQQVPQPLVTTRYETSPNWSGAYIQPDNGAMFTVVAGLWTIPSITKPGGLSGNVGLASSVWVGLDGQRRYFNSSLPQIGTRQEFDAHGNAQYSAWYQWWVRGQTGYAPNLVPITVTSNDTVFCQVQVQSPTQVTVSLTKLGPLIENWNMPLSAPISPLTNTQPQIAGATAEWVVERPTMLHTDTLFALPNFGMVEFTNCVAEAQPAPPYSLNATSQNLSGARFIQMFERLDSPARTLNLSKPRRLIPDQQNAFKVAYIGP